MLEWKARILTLAISVAVIWDQLGDSLARYNWNW
jgi:hypothetical protein